MLVVAATGLLTGAPPLWANKPVGQVVRTIHPAQQVSLPEPDESPTRWRDLSRPTPLTPDEEQHPAGALLARRFNPAMAFVHPDIWPVAVQYAFADGAPLVGRILGDGGAIVREFIALPNHRVRTHDWGDLPLHDSEGRAVQYHVDAPGDDKRQGNVTAWRRRFREIQSLNRHDGRVAYPPTQYAHLFWWNRTLGLLAIQYWFYYPYNEWINHHEGDWEHVNVILHGPSRLDDDSKFRVAGYQFFFHHFAHEPDRVVRVAGSDPREDHLMVYVGGRSQFLSWSGVQSGGSYPLPARYPRTGGGVLHLRADDDVRNPVRFIRAEDFTIVMLPEPDRLDVGLRPELSWLRVPFFAGQTRVHHNPLSMNGMAFGRTPQQPARQATWNALYHPQEWPDEVEVDPMAIALPPDFRPLLTPVGGKPTPKVRLQARKRLQRKPERSLARTE